MGERSGSTLHGKDSGEHALLLGKVAHHPEEGFGIAPHEGRKGDHLMLGATQRFLQQVDHLKGVTVGEMLLTDPANIGQGGSTPRGLAGDI